MLGAFNPLGVPGALGPGVPGHAAAAGSGVLGQGVPGAPGARPARAGVRGAGVASTGP